MNSRQKCFFSKGGSLTVSACAHIFTFFQILKQIHEYKIFIFYINNLPMKTHQHESVKTK